MKALTTSEITAILIRKGYNPLYIIRNVPENKWGGDTICFQEYLEDGFSRVALCKYTPYDWCQNSGTITRIVSYRELKAADKKEFQALIESLPNK